MANSVLQLLRPSVITGIMNEVKTPYDRWQNFFGFEPGGSNCVPSETRTVGIDIVDDDRTVSTFRAPGANAETIAPMVIGNRTVTAPRSFEKLPLSYETLNNIRRIGEGASSLDKAGMVYVKQQSAHMVRRFRRFREFLIWGMLRGACQFSVSGNTWTPVISGGDVTLDWQVPADHKNQAGGIIAASWDTSTTDIPNHLAQLDAKSEEDSGMPLEHAWCNTTRWLSIAQNDKVKALAGTANTPFKEWNADYRVYPGEAGIKATHNEMMGVIEGYPSILWHITNRGIKLNGTYTKYLGDDEVILHPAPDNEWTFMYEVKESTNQAGSGVTPPTDVYGYGNWIKYPVDSDIPHYLLYSLDNCFPVVNPKAIFFLDVTP